MTAGERDLLEAAAAQAHTNLSDFIRRKAIEAAEMELLDRRLVIIPAADWDRFAAWANAPARVIPELVELAASRPVQND